MDFLSLELLRSIVENYGYPFVTFDQNTTLFLTSCTEDPANPENKACILSQLLANKDNPLFILNIPKDNKTYKIAIGSGTSGNKPFYFASIKDNVLVDKESFLSYMIEYSSVSIIALDKDLRIFYVNKFSLDLYGYREDELTGQLFNILSGEDDKHAFIQNCIKQADLAGVWRGEDYRRKKDGTRFPSSASITRLVDPNGKFLCYYDASRDNSVRFQEKKALEILLKRDELTGIPNRRQMVSMLEQNWMMALIRKLSFGIIFVDIDDFKLYNDTYGHLTGDKVLIRIARTMQSIMRSSDLIARYGGEEFVAILVGTSKQKILEIADRLLNGIRALAIPHKASTVADIVTISLGVSLTMPDEKHYCLECVSNADKALYIAKSKDKNRYEYYEPVNTKGKQHHK